MVIIRWASKIDVVIIQKIIAEAINLTPQYPDSVKDKEIANCSQNLIEESIYAQLCLVAEDDGEIVGVCFGEDEDGPIWLSWIVVRPSHQRQGIGDKLIKTFLHIASAQGTKVWCSSLIANRGSMKLLYRCGFNQTTTLLNHWHGLDFILWQKFF